MEGKYYCCAVQENKDHSTYTLNSEMIEVAILPIPCTVLKKPDDIIYLCEGSPIVLKLNILAYPPPAFVWTYKNAVLEYAKTNTLFVSIIF